MIILLLIHHHMRYYLNDAASQSTLVTYLENLDGIRQVNRSEATASGLASAARLVSYVQ